MINEPRQTIAEQERDEMVDIVLTAIEETFGINRADDKLKHSQEHWYLDARKIFFANLYPHFGTMTEIGEYLEKDHSTVTNAVRRYGEHYRTDKEFRRKADMVKVLIKKQLNEKK
jgi:chromosomal replication initiation ATPase DnaA